MVLTNLSVEVASRFMGVNPQFIRVGLQRNILPFGYAVTVGGNRYTYYISPMKFSEYTGIPLEDVEAAEEAIEGRKHRWTTVNR